MLANRKELYSELEASRGSKVLVYITGDRPKLETQIGNDAYIHFISHLDKIGVTPKISLYLYTTGGDVMAAWSIINLVKMFCDELEVIVPSKCLSAGTIMSLGASRIIMTKQSTLG